MVALERLDVAGATLLTDELLDCCETLRVELEPATLRLELDPETLRLELLLLTLRLELLLLTLRLELLLLTLRLELEPDTLRFDELPETDLDAMPDAVETERLALEPDTVRLAVLRLRFRSHPPLFKLRLGVYRSTLELVETYTG